MAKLPSQVGSTCEQELYSQKYIDLIDKFPVVIILSLRLFAATCAVPPPYLIHDLSRRR